MNSDILKGSWHEAKGKLRSQWGKLTDDDIDYVSGRSEHLSGVLQKRYGMQKDEADREVDNFINKLSR